MRSPMRTAGVGRVNDRIAMDLLLHHGVLTRGQLRALTGMAQPTTAVLVDRLASRGLIEAAGQSRGKRGPGAQRYQVARGSVYVAAARVNANEAAAAISDVAGCVVAQTRAPVVDAKVPVAEILGVLRAAAAEAGLTLDEIEQFVIGTPGSVDPVTGDVSYVSGHPEWHGNVKQPLAQVLGPLRLENQLKLAGLAEFSSRREEGRDSLALLSIGPGVGAAIILNGKAWPGASGGAGEVAYLPVPGADVPQVDNRRNYVAGGFGDLLSAESLQSVRTHRAGDSEQAGLDELRRSADGTGDPRLAREVARRVAVGAAAIVAVLDPGLIVLTGRIARAGGQPLVALVLDELSRISPWQRDVELSCIHGDAVLEGAIISALGPVRDALWGPRTVTLGLNSPATEVDRAHSVREA